ncbi:hypothetical protein [Sphingopyxis indica]|uniref:hypothetical protein n=1 Tax=Sphingopyxis indica TaxID=436663 RepID=UPI0037420B29
MATPFGSRARNIASPTSTPPKRTRRAAPRKRGSAAQRPTGCGRGSTRAPSASKKSRDSDRYGRKLRIVVRGGTSVGSVLVAEGLARPWEGRRRPWC